jgi:signal peptidase I
MSDGWFTPVRIIVLLGLLAVARVLVSLAGGDTKGRKSVTEVLDSALIALTLVFVVIRPLVVQSFYIPTGSMEPTLLGADTHPIGDRVLVCKFLYRINPPLRGDIIVFVAPPRALGLTYRSLSGEEETLRSAPEDFIKRLIGLPGDRIQIRAGEGVYVNGRLMPEPYRHSDEQMVSYNYPENNGEYQDRFPPPGPEFEVPAGQVFVLGDNRNSSNDSHIWGTLPMTNIVGKAMAIFWPIGRLRVLE